MVYCRKRCPLQRDPPKREILWTIPGYYPGPPHRPSHEMGKRTEPRREEGDQGEDPAGFRNFGQERFRSLERINVATMYIPMMGWFMASGKDTEDNSCIMFYRR